MTVARGVLQHLFDVQFPDGASVVFSEDFQFYVPRVLVEAVQDDRALLMLWDVTQGNQPLHIEVKVPTSMSDQLLLETDDDIAVDGDLAIYANFPPSLAEAREEMLKSAWFEDAPDE